MQSKRLVFNLLLISGILLSTHGQDLLNAETNSPPLPPVRPEAVTPLELQKSLNPSNTSTFRFTSNKDMPQANFLTKEEFLTSLNKKAVLKSFELMTYREYVTKTPYASLPSDISPDRMVVVVKSEFPEGLEAYNADYGPGAIVVSVRDALTRQLFEYSITGNTIRQKGPGVVMEPGKATPSPTKPQPSYCADPGKNATLECQQF